MPCRPIYIKTCLNEVTIIFDLVDMIYGYKIVRIAENLKSSVMLLFFSNTHM